MPLAARHACHPNARHRNALRRLASRHFARRVALVVLVLLASALAHADSWAPPTPITVVSRDRSHRLTIYPRPIGGPSEAADALDGRAPAGPHPGAPARCEATLERLGPGAYEVLWRKPLVNAVAPTSALVADDGRFVTFDNWHHVGMGPHAIALYAADGTPVRTRAVAEVIGEAAYRALPASVSSVWWGGVHRLGGDGASIELQVLDMRGSDGGIAPDADAAEPSYRTLRLDLATGEVLAGHAVE